ncbi:PucR family transcriptional regulator [Actinophytocola oryzae]|uniref:PucR-like helix-turn-helix protein n=1 Tax=Actinophytocola oryzae TaxID=502181 RepID=A0A4R7VRN1_9PSEU|nr:PucR family transcriptional regulator [Actinophytocola oryzae]TDV52115.1 PucR-like helix-turn-helix protein [Actinophytocola oryzae]
MAVQLTVDDLAARLGRPVLLEDHAQSVLAYSEQTGPMDDVRRDSILRRHTARDVRARFRSAGIFEARGPLRVPGSPGVLSRVCVPVRHRDRLLGFLWLIDSPVMSDSDLELAAKSAGELALVLLHDVLAAGVSAQREQAALARLLSGDASSVGVLVDEGGFPPLPVTVLVVRGAAREVLADGLLAARGRFSARHLVRGDHGVLVCAGPVRADSVPGLFTGPVVVGVGTTRGSLTGAAESYVEALHASVVAQRVPGFGPVTPWESLGVYRMLAAVPVSAIHPGVLRLSPELVSTLETYLDLAGSAVETSRVLRLHRTSLYYRLQRVAELTGTSLKNGDERLTLHLSLKLARLHGLLG